VRRLLNESFSGADTGTARDIALVNAAGALVVSGLVDELREGVELAAKTVDSGKAEEKLKNLIKILSGKPPTSLKEVVSQSRLI